MTERYFRQAGGPVNVEPTPEDEWTLVLLIDQLSPHDQARAITLTVGSDTKGDAPAEFELRRIPSGVLINSLVLPVIGRMPLTPGKSAKWEMPVDAKSLPPGDSLAVFARRVTDGEAVVSAQFSALYV